MDGNNRWSKKNNISKKKAYERGANNLIKLSNYLFKNYDVRYISAFALSTNNLKRSANIIKLLIKILSNFLDQLDSYKKLDYKIELRGNINFLDKSLINKIHNLHQINLKKEKSLIIFINYGGREDIINGLRKINLNKVDTNNFKDSLCTYDLPDPEILIRSGGYQRLSNFMLYELSFTELFFSKTLWPDFNTKNIIAIIEKYKKVRRKFGY